MTERASWPWKLAFSAMLLCAVAIGLAALSGLFQPAPSGPVPIAWDAEPCADCRMLIGDPAYAAQLQTEDGRVLNFDDPGCLFHLLQRRPISPRAIYFHHAREQRWLTPEQVGFVSAARTPMGYGLAAVERTTPGARSFEDVARSPLTAADTHQARRGDAAKVAPRLPARDAEQAAP